MMWDLNALQDLTWWTLKLNKKVHQSRGDIFFLGKASHFFFFFFSENLMFWRWKAPWRLWNVNTESSQTQIMRDIHALLLMLSTGIYKWFPSIQSLSETAILLFCNNYCIFYTKKYCEHTMGTLLLSLIILQDLITNIHQSKGMW